MLVLKSLFFTLVFPGTVTGLVPWLIVSRGIWMFDVGFYRYGGIFPIALGLPGLIWCIVEFACVGRGTLATIDPPRFAVRRGLYRVVRNPMYLCVVKILLGESLLLQSWAIALWAVSVAMIFHLFVVFYEEPNLRRRFGREYEEYLRAVPRWLPIRR
ncbi:MAG: isoprenylcysteine carboxylmethyltransferase family protein [Armatimonadetes bacterium]|nr:isoprenylcysteine carboxylmethyltransferase family protein [Armatimonadota bacterium]